VAAVASILRNLCRPGCSCCPAWFKRPRQRVPPNALTWRGCRCRKSLQSS